MANGINFMEEYSLHIIPILGLYIEDQENWKDFIFDDASLLNKNQLKQYIEHNGLNMNDSYLKFFEDYKTFLIIKTDSNNIKIDRELEVLSFIFFIFLIEYEYKASIKSENLFYSNTFSRRITINKNGGSSFDQRYSNGQFIICNVLEDNVLSRFELLELFKKDKYLSLFQIINSNSEYEEVKKSLLNFIFSINTPNLNFQFVGINTSIEVLFKKEKDNTFNMKKRIHKLYNLYNLDLNYNKEDIDNLIEKRNEIIHEAKNAKKNDVFNFIKFYCETLILYTQEIIKYKTKESLLNYLDLN